MLIDILADDRTLQGSSAPPGLREKLRQSTAEAHRSLDERFGGFDLTSVDGYRRFLEASAAALLPLEAALEDAGVAGYFSDWPERSRRTAILSDLKRIGGTVSPLTAVPPMNRNTVLGAMYVLEGSRLGAKYLLRTIAGGDPLISTATEYLSHGGGAKLWPTFLLRLAEVSVTIEDEAEIVAGAHLAFAMFAEAAKRA